MNPTNEDAAMDRLHAEEAFSLFAGTAPIPGRRARPVSMQVMGWVGGIPEPVNGPLQAISGGTWCAIPVGSRLSLDVGFGGQRHVRSISFEAGDGPPGPVAVTIFARVKQTGLWKLVRRCPLPRPATRCVIPPQHTDAIRMEFEVGEHRHGVPVGIGPLVVDMKQFQ
jgi:hypothetical protein